MSHGYKSKLPHGAKDLVQRKFSLSGMQVQSLECITERLESHYKLVERLVLSKQNPQTGLLPASTENNVHGNYTDAWVRDNVYSILCVWGLALCYRKLPEGDRAYQLEMATVRCMRGLLKAMMGQSAKVEKFKTTQNTMDALHAKYDTPSGNTVVADDAWGHLQLDATSLFVLYVAQMTASGLRIIYNADEVSFVQNLVYYLEMAYRTPDFGLWERGNKINNGHPELNSSSIGMAKAALEAIQKVDLFHSASTNSGGKVTSFQDETFCCYQHLVNVLPRESCSKEVDAALLSIISFPGFAVDDSAIYQMTKDEIIGKLEGRYGCKRFLRDGHQCENEDTQRLHYEEWELKKFEHIECEWPLFFTYLYLDGLFINNMVQAETYRSILIQNAVKGPNGELLIPELYIVPAAEISKEQEDPGSVDRKPNHNVPLVWAQSLFLLAEMIYDGVLALEDVDPLKRRDVLKNIGVHAPPPRMMSSRRMSKIFEEFRTPSKDVNDKKSQSQGVGASPLHEMAEVNVLVCAESQGLRSTVIKALGETFPVICPSQAAGKGYYFRPSSHLVKVFRGFGECPRLGLSGRPPRRIEGFSTSVLYRLPSENGLRSVLFVPDTLDGSDFYFRHDEDFMVSMIRNAIVDLSENWKGGCFADGKPPLFLFYLTNSLWEFPSVKGMLKESGNGLAGYDAENPLSAPMKIISLDELVQFGESNLEGQLGGVNLGFIRREFLFDEPAIQDSSDEQVYFYPSIQDVSHPKLIRSSSGSLLDSLPRQSALEQQLRALESLASEVGLDSTNTGVVLHQDENPPTVPTVRDLVWQVLERAPKECQWALARRSAALLKLVFKHGLTSCIQSLMIETGLTLTIGEDGCEEDWNEMRAELGDEVYVIDKLVQSSGGSWLRCVIQQELLVCLGSLVKREPQLFDQIFRIQLGQLTKLLLSRLESDSPCERSSYRSLSKVSSLLSLRPSSSKSLLSGAASDSLDASPSRFQEFVKEIILCDMGPSYAMDAARVTNGVAAPSEPRFESCFQELRELHGVLSKTPPSFAGLVWQLLHDTQWDLVGTRTKPKMTFRWNGGGSNVIVRGSWNGWAEPGLQLKKVGHGVFEGDFELSDRSVDFKFVVDGDWKTNDHLQKVSDGHGGSNNRVEASGGDGQILTSNLCLQMTQEEPLFGRCVIGFLSHIRRPEHRQLVVEFICVLAARASRRNDARKGGTVSYQEVLEKCRDDIRGSVQTVLGVEEPTEMDLWEGLYAMHPQDFALLAAKQLQAMGM